MSQTTQLINSDKAMTDIPAQIVALEPRLGEQIRSSEKYIRILQLSDLLSRHLEIDQIVEAFMAEIGGDVQHTGYRFVCDDIDVEIARGRIQGASASYRLKMQHRLLGELSLFRPGRFSEQDLRDLEDLICALIYPLKNALMYQIALKSAYRDPLTGLNNRTSMEKHLPREIELARRHNQSMALLVMDLDGFKQINDRCGHDVGDQVLRDVGQVISQVVRNTDLVYRYGGDEFVGGLSQTDLNGAIDVSERIRGSIDELRLNNLGAANKVKISIGITLVRQDDNFKTAFKRADKALYQAKISREHQIIVG